MTFADHLRTHQDATVRTAAQWCRSVPADLALGDGMVAVDRERLREWANQWEETHLKSIGKTFAKRVCDRGLDAIRRAHHAADHPCVTCDRIDALRANQGGDEHA